MKTKTKEFTYTDSLEIVLALHVLVRGYGTAKKTAEALGVSPQFLNDLLAGRRDITTKIAAHFGMKPIRIFVPIENQMSTAEVGNELGNAKEVDG